MDRELAALTVAWTTPQPVPEGLRGRVEDAGRRAVSDRRACDNTRHATPPPRQTPVLARVGYLGYAALAASLALAAVVALKPLSDNTLDTPANQYAALTATDAKATRVAFSPLAVNASATGDVAWAEDQTTGAMRLVGLPSNEGEDWQYQLWVVDQQRDDRPVDGGVFDIPAGDQPAYVAFRPALPVDRPTAFAITREKRGGVVVSRGPMLMVALVEPAG